MRLPPDVSNSEILDRLRRDVRNGEGDGEGDSRIKVCLVEYPRRDDYRLRLEKGDVKGLHFVVVAEGVGVEAAEVRTTVTHRRLVLRGDESIERTHVYRGSIGEFRGLDGRRAAPEEGEQLQSAGGHGRKFD